MTLVPNDCCLPCTPPPPLLTTGAGNSIFSSSPFSLSPVLARDSCFSRLLSPDSNNSLLAELVLEKSLHRSVLKPLRPILAARLRRRLSTDGSLGRLAEGFRLARTQGPGAFGSHLNLSSPVEIEPVRQKLLQLLRAYSPSAQIKWLLQACKLLYTALKTQAGMTPLPQPLPPAPLFQSRGCALPTSTASRFQNPRAASSIEGSNPLFQEL